MLHTQIQKPLQPRIPPRLELLDLRAGLDEVLHLHLLKLTGAEKEILRVDFVAKRLANLRDAKGNFLARGFHHVFEGTREPDLPRSPALVGQEIQHRNSGSGAYVLFASGSEERNFFIAGYL